MKTKIILLLITTIAFVACSPTIPEHANKTTDAVDIYPDYADVTIPRNIAPLNFEIRTQADDYITHIYSRKQTCHPSIGGNEGGFDAEGFTVSGRTVSMDIDQWHDLLATSEGDSIFIDVYTKSDGAWQQHPTVKMAVAEDIDPYVTYRLIEPSYINFEVMSINQRCLETFDAAEIFNNQYFAGDTKGQCMNCHSAQDYNRGGRWQMHIRLENGGTLMADNGKLTKLNLKLPETISAGVYPAWHPSLPLIVYSNNKTDQMFQASNRNKIEVQDNASDLILYDLESNEVSIIANDSTEWETFPAWSPDGKWLYYVSATIPPMTTEQIDGWRNAHYKDIRYNIYRRRFDAASKTFSKPDTVYLAALDSVSATLPRISPDGKHLLYTQGEYGTFHIWHHDADLWMIDISDDGFSLPYNVEALNSTDTESYHSFSSNGRWIIFSSRRDDGNYTRLYIAYFDKQGKAHKPFLLPQRNPHHNTHLFKSYNIPEFIAQPVTTPHKDIIRVLSQPATDVKLHVK